MKPKHRETANQKSIKLKHNRICTLQYAAAAHITIVQ